ncbi:PREDICTED: dynein assembly factor 3, axonemal-like isoform X1 [Priapulus caudatus]|uniref:Dynein assembly factor 3, axonemal-like isoform X1 n=1 Tax=Priapulus caudatus TaxID=37621 RepID=A0ABM1DSP6_PRICU|nr:PREDICTED: dynein assembly factor 3, axonemal-like isoform X1 [Priapulus caudatus]
MVDGIGSVTWWGFSPAINLIPRELEVSELNVLLVGSGDSRHIIKTMAEAWRFPSVKVNIYVIEHSLQVLARHMLFLSLALEPAQHIGLSEKTSLYLEIFGNSLIRSSTKSYIDTKASDFIRMVSDVDIAEDMLPILDMNFLKFKERDGLEAVFKFWKVPHDTFGIQEMWDNRVRHYLGQRYDSRQNAYDWDYCMKLCERGAKIIGKPIYKQWRETGLAFEVREGDYTVPNKTLTSCAQARKGPDTVPLLGYWGDIVTGPFISHGIECANSSLLKTENKMHVKTAKDITYYNVMAMFYELLYKTKYDECCLEIEAKQDEDSVMTRPQRALVDSCYSSGDVSDSAPVSEGPIVCENAKVYFLPLNAPSQLYLKQRFQEHFHVVYFSNSMVHTLTPDLSKTFACKAQVIVETPKFLIDVTTDQAQEYMNKVVAMTEKAGCEMLTSCNPSYDALAYFRYSAS